MNQRNKDLLAVPVIFRKRDMSVEHIYYCHTSVECFSYCCSVYSKSTYFNTIACIIRKRMFDHATLGCSL